MANDSGIGSLLDRSVDNPLSPIFSISFALSSALCATSAEWELEITLRDSLFSEFSFFGRSSQIGGQIAYAYFPSLASSAAFGSTGFTTHFLF